MNLVVAYLTGADFNKFPIIMSWCFILICLLYNIAYRLYNFFII